MPVVSPNVGLVGQPHNIDIDQRMFLGRAKVVITHTILRSYRHVGRLGSRDADERLQNYTTGSMRRFGATLEVTSKACGRDVERRKYMEAQKLRLHVVALATRRYRQAYRNAR